MDHFITKLLNKWENMFKNFIKMAGNIVALCTTQ